MSSQSAFFLRTRHSYVSSHLTRRISFNPKIPNTKTNKSSTATNKIQFPSNFSYFFPLAAKPQLFFNPIAQLRKLCHQELMDFIDSLVQVIFEVNCWRRRRFLGSFSMGNSMFNSQTGWYGMEILKPEVCFTRGQKKSQEPLEVDETIPPSVTVTTSKDINCRWGIPINWEGRASREVVYVVSGNECDDLYRTKLIFLLRHWICLHPLSDIGYGFGINLESANSPTECTSIEYETSGYWDTLKADICFVKFLCICLGKLIETSYMTHHPRRWIKQIVVSRILRQLCG